MILLWKMDMIWVFTSRSPSQNWVVCAYMLQSFQALTTVVQVCSSSREWKQIVLSVGAWMVLLKRSMQSLWSRPMITCNPVNQAREQEQIHTASMRFFVSVFESWVLLWTLLRRLDDVFERCRSQYMQYLYFEIQPCWQIWSYTLVGILILSSSVKYMFKEESLILTNGHTRHIVNGFNIVLSTIQPPLKVLDTKNNWCHILGQLSLLEIPT
jgi:hypothetical protein